MSIRKHGNGYQVRYPGFRAKTLPTKRDAERFELGLKQRALNDDYYEPTILFSEAIDGYLARLASMGDLRPRTHEFYAAQREALRVFDRYRIPRLRRAVVEDHFAERAAKAPVAARNELQLLKRVLRNARARGQRIDEAVLDLTPVKHEPRRGKALTAKQLYELAAWFPDEQQNLILLAGMVGARQHFWFQMTKDMLDLQRGTMDAPADMQKNRRDHRVHLTDLERSLFREQVRLTVHSRLVFPGPDGRPWDRFTFRNRVWDPSMKLARKANPAVFEGFTFHLLRHTAGSLMALAGLDPAVAAERIGHSDGGALFLKTYRHLYASERERGARLLGAFIESESRAAEKAAVDA